MNLHNKKILYANGCSYMCGSEIEGYRIFESEYNLRWCFAGQIANKYGLEYFNEAQPGSSNDRIVRTTMLWISDSLRSGIKSEDIFCIIGWTNPQRFELYYKDNWMSWIPGSGKEMGDWAVDKRQKLDYQELDRYSIKYLVSEYGNLTKLINQIILLSMFFKYLNVDFVMLNSSHSPGYDKYFKEHSGLKYLFPYRHFFEHHMGFHSRYFRKVFRGHFMKNINGHPDKFLHTLYFEELDQFITEEV